MREVALRALLGLERTAASIRGAKRTPAVIEPYMGYTTPEGTVLRGRVLSRNRPLWKERTSSRWRNFKAMVGLFRTSEVAYAEVSALGQTTTCDDEGYFRFLLTGQHRQVEVKSGKARAICTAQLPDPEARFVIISDIDDTLIKTGADQLLTNLWTSMTGNAATRLAFDDAIALMASLREGERNPAFLVSSSPWNLYGFLRHIFDRFELPHAPMFLRDYGLGPDQLITGTHGDHKGQAIDKIMAANPGLPVVCMGDTGQHDAAVYADAAQRHPGRIHAVFLREAADGTGPEDRKYLDQLNEMGITTRADASFDAARAHFEEQGLSPPQAKA